MTLRVFQNSYSGEQPLVKVAYHIFMINELRLLRVPNFIALRIYFWGGPNFPGMRRLILALMSNVCYLTVILIFLVCNMVVTARYLMVTTGYCSLPCAYCSLPLFTARSHF